MKRPFDTEIAKHLPPPSLGSGHWNGEDDWKVWLKKVMKDGTAGILSTIGVSGHPHGRWMATVSSEFYPNLYALTSATSRKVREIEANPDVTWMFFNQDLSFIANLSGTARILRDEASERSVYRVLPEDKRADFVDRYLSGEIVVVETAVETVEITSPINAFRHVGPARELGLGRSRLESFEDRSNLDGWRSGELAALAPVS